MSTQYMILGFILFFFGLFFGPILQGQVLRVGVIGLEHDHVHWIFNSEKKGEIEIVGIVESNRALVDRFAQRYGFSKSLVHSEIENMLDATKPEALTAFNRIYGHLAIVEAAAPRGIHVMVEKPLAINLEHAEKMKALAEKHKIHLLTNYETTWYGSNHAVYAAVRKDEIGPIRKIVVHDGHPGPREIGCSEEFLTWLTDPKWNGAGALTDFGCYGANLATWLMDNQRPISVTAIAQTIKPLMYPKVDDEATIIVQYPDAQAIIQASWNWPISRKDMFVYGKTGYMHALDREKVAFRENEKTEVIQKKYPDRTAPFDDPFSYLKAVIRGDVEVKGSLSSMENNIIAMEILDAAMRSVKEKKTIFLP